jgi:hypothetical protein
MPDNFSSACRCRAVLNMPPAAATARDSVAIFIAVLEPIALPAKPLQQGSGQSEPAFFAHKSRRGCNPAVFLKRAFSFTEAPNKFIEAPAPSGRPPGPAAWSPAQERARSDNTACSGIEVIQ